MLRLQDYLIDKEFNASSVSVKIPQEAVQLDSKRSDLNQTISELHAKREELKLKEQNSIDTAHLTKEISEITKKLTDYHRQLDNIKISRDRGSQALERARREVRAKLLREADIVLATLSGSGHDTLRDVKDMEFPTVGVLDSNVLIIL
jgi:hypothetical protein